MLANVPAALMRFRRRLRLRAFVVGSTFAATCLAAGGAAVLVAVHLTDRAAPAWLGEGWRGPAAAALLVLAAASIFGSWRAVRARVDDARLAEHLEQRLGTGGLLLVAGEGVALPEPFGARLAARLQQVDAVLPPVDVAARVWRPALALALLVGAALLPPPLLPAGGGEAAMAALSQLDDRVEALAADPRVPDDVRQELQAAVQDLEQRVDGGEDDLWREIDQLTERVDREVTGLSTASAAGGPGNRDGGGATAGGGVGSAARDEQERQARAGQLSKAAELLQQAARWPAATAGLSDDARALLDAASDEHGVPDAARLAADPRLSPELAEQLATALASALEAAAGAPETSPALAEQAAQLAAALSRAAPMSPEQQQELMRSVAEGAKALADLGEGVEGLALALQDALGAGAAALAEQALRNLDLASLMALLPDDPRQLQALAEQLAELARQVAQSSPASPAPSSGAGSAGSGAAAAARGMSAEQRAQLEQLAERLAGAAAGGRGAGGPPGVGQLAAGQPGGAAGAAGGAAGVGAAGEPGRGGGHAALRMTEHVVGDAPGELELPTPLDPQQLDREWRPVRAQKAAPEVGAPQVPAPGSGAAVRGDGAATWQLRLMPRHRAVVQRFFSGGNASASATPGERGGDKK